MRTVLPCVLLFSLLAGCNGRRGPDDDYGGRPAGSAPASPTGQVSEADLEKQVVEHPFWKKRPTKEQLDRIVSLLADKGATGYLAVNDRGEVRHHTSPAEVAHEHAGERYTILNADAIYPNPTRPAALAELKKRLDRFLAEEKYRAKAKG